MLLATKLFVPRLRSSTVQRARLFDRLDAAEDVRLTLVAAPAGFGKTALLSSWIHAHGEAAAWLSLDDADDDPVRLWTYLIHALRAVDEAIGESALPLLQSAQQLPTEAIATIVLNDIASAAPRRFVLVLDDYHVLSDATIQDSLAFFLEQLPPNARLIVATREDPPWPLARLRAGGDLAEIRAVDLRFTEEEAARFLDDAGLTLSEADVRTLEHRTEGWIAGLKMAALSIEGRSDATTFVRDFAGSSHRFVLDYLADEVLKNLPDGLRTFLVQTSILERLSGELCDAVTGLNRAHEILERLEQENLFTEALDDERRWYRYHQLFAEVLRSQLRERAADEAHVLHSRAANWLAAHGFTAEAIDHALAADDFERAARLVEESAETTLWRDSQHAAVLGWMEALPGKVVASRPKLGLLHAWARFTTGEWGAVEPLLQQAERALAETPDADGKGALGEAAAIRSGIAYESGEMPRSIELAREALELLPERATPIRAVAAFQLGLGSFFTGDRAAAQDAFTEAATVAAVSGNLTIALLAIGCQVQLAVEEGRLCAAEEAYERARQLGTSAAGWTLPPAGLAFVHMGEVLRERDDLAAAERVVREGIDLCRQQGAMPEHVLEGLVCLARVLSAAEDEAGSVGAMQQAEQLLAELRSRPGDTRPIIAHAVANGLRWFLARHDPAGADRWLGEESLAEAGGEPARTADSIVRARVLLAHDQHDAAGRALDHAAGAVDGGAPGTSTEILVLRALVILARGDEPRAAELLAQALEHGEPEGYVRLFVDEGQSMQRLLQRSVDDGVAPQYAKRLLAAFTGEEARTGDLLEPLNERERAVLQMFAAGRSNREIANELYLSVNTVKWHARNLYEKLGVHRRALAIARARELGILR